MLLETPLTTVCEHCGHVVPYQVVLERTYISIPITPEIQSDIPIFLPMAYCRRCKMSVKIPKVMEERKRLAKQECEKRGISLEYLPESLRTEDL